MTKTQSEKQIKRKRNRGTEKMKKYIARMSPERYRKGKLGRERKR